MEEHQGVRLRGECDAHQRGMRARDLQRSPSSCVCGLASCYCIRLCPSAPRAPTLTETPPHPPSRPVHRRCPLRVRSSLNRSVLSTATSAASSTAADTSRRLDVTTARRASAYVCSDRKPALRLFCWAHVWGLPRVWEGQAGTAALAEEASSGSIAPRTHSPVSTPSAMHRILHRI